MVTLNRQRLVKSLRLIPLKPGAGPVSQTVYFRWKMRNSHLLQSTSQYRTKICGYLTVTVRKTQSAEEEEEGAAWKADAKKLQCRRQLKHHLQTVGQGGVHDPENEPSESEHVNTETHSERRRARVRRANVKTSLNTDRPSEPRGKNKIQWRKPTQVKHSASHLKYSDLKKVKFGFFCSLGHRFCPLG